MSYMLLIVEPIGQRAERTPEEGAQLNERMSQFGAELEARGVLLAAESLESTRGAARVQKRAGRIKTLDGPFAESKEMVGGFFLLDVETREEALAIAEQCPAAEWCTGRGPQTRAVLRVKRHRAAIVGRANIF